VLSTGYNGVAAGMPHCNEAISHIASIDMPGAAVVDGVARRFEYPNACPGSRAASGTNLDGCHALHAEQNALLQCKDPWSIHTAYVTASPCMTCTKLLLNTSCQRVVFLEPYPHSAAQDLWESAGRLWEHFIDR